MRSQIEKMHALRQETSKTVKIFGKLSITNLLWQQETKDTVIPKMV